MDSCLRRNDGVGMALVLRAGLKPAPTGWRTRGYFRRNDGWWWHTGYFQRNPPWRLSPTPSTMKMGRPVRPSRQMAGDWIPAPYRGTGQALRRNDGVRMALVLRGGFETRPYEYGRSGPIFVGMTDGGGGTMVIFSSNWPCRLPPTPSTMKMGRPVRPRTADGRGLDSGPVSGYGAGSPPE